jgi:streptogramin lyase/plastocyanin
MRIPVGAFIILGFCTTTGANVESTQRSGWFREIALCEPGCGPAIVAVDGADAVWVAVARAGKLARYSDGRLEQFDLGIDSRPVGLAVARDALWIAASYDNKIIRFDVRTHRLQGYPIDVPNSWPFFVAIGKNGTIWFSERAAGEIGNLDPGTGAFRHFHPPTPHSGPAGMAVDRRTGVVWFTESYADRIASLDPETGHITEYPMGQVSSGLVSGPAGIGVDANGDIWFAKLEGKIGHLAAGAQSIELIDTPSEARRPAGLTIDVRGEIWVAALDGNCILRYQPYRRRFVSYAIPTGMPDTTPLSPPAAQTSRPFGIAADSEGNIWFSEQYTGQLGVLDNSAPKLSILSPSGTVTNPSMLVTARAADRVAGINTVVWTIDNQPVKVEHGRVAVSSLAPGLHTLEMSAKNLAGHASRVRATFTWAPEKTGHVRVRIIDVAPYLDPAVVEVHRGDTVDWRYEPSADAHAPSYGLRRIVIEGARVSSNLLRSGDTFSYRFDQEGVFQIHTGAKEPAAAAGLVKVAGP